MAENFKALVTINVSTRGYSSPSAVSIGPGSGKAWLVEAMWAVATGTVNPVIDVGVSSSSPSFTDIKLAPDRTLVLGAPAVNLLLGRTMSLENGQTLELDTISGTWNLLFSVAECND